MTMIAVITSFNRKSRLNKNAVKAQVLIRAVGELQELRRKATINKLSSAEEQRAMCLQAKIEEWQARFNARTLAPGR